MKRIGDILVDMGFLELEQLQMALVETRKTRTMLGEVLLRLDWITEEQLQMAIAVQSGADVLDPKRIEVDHTVIANIPYELASTHKLLPFSQEDGVLKIATSNPFDVLARDKLTRLTGLPCRSYIAPADWISKAIELHYKTAVTIDEDIEQITHSGALEAGFDEKQIIQLADLILEKGYVLGASDIHIVSDTRLTRIYYRIDGVLQQRYLFPLHFHQSLATRYKVMGDMDISNQNIPHDGRIKFEGKVGNFDLRVSTFPTHLGETVVMRLLAYNKVVGDLNRLGFEPEDLSRFLDVIKRPYGLILTTGPTGSGKTTTLYSALMTINSPQINVMTIEDPIEYMIPTIRQTPVNPKAGLTFGNALRAAMRQDPDVILVGEIRDKETAELAVRASITGHLVLSTLHTNDAVSTIGRLIDLGISTSMLSTSLTMIVAQRLLRRICPDCQTKRELSPKERKLFLDNGIEAPAEAPYPKGCPQCNETGYRGRAGLYEVLKFDKELERLVSEGAPHVLLEEAAVNAGATLLIKQALKKITQGITTMDEILRVVANA